MKFNFKNKSGKSKELQIMSLPHKSHASAKTDYTLPKAIVVKNNQIKSINGITYADLEYEIHMTFDEFFDYIEDRQNQNPVIENLEFDSIYGFPSYTYFDISEMIADDEIGYTITNFIPTK